MSQKSIPPLFMHLSSHRKWMRRSVINWPIKTITISWFIFTGWTCISMVGIRAMIEPSRFRKMCHRRVCVRPKLWCYHHRRSRGQVCRRKAQGCSLVVNIMGSMIRVWRECVVPSFIGIGEALMLLKIHLPKLMGLLAVIIWLWFSYRGLCMFLDGLPFVRFGPLFHLRWLMTWLILLLCP